MPELTLYVGRFVSVIFGAFTVLFCWAAVRQLAPDEPLWAVTVALIVALLPQVSANTSSVSNDSAANFAGAFALYIWLRVLRQPTFDPYLLKSGAVLGLCVLAKLNTLVLAPGLGILIIVRVLELRSQVESPRGHHYLNMLGALVKYGLYSLAAILGVCGWWLVRNIIAYGEVTGTQESFRFHHANLVQIGDYEGLRDIFLQLTWEGLWGRFGMFNLVLPRIIYIEAIVISTVCALLSVTAAMRLAPEILRHKRRIDPYVWQFALITITALSIMTAMYIQYSFTVAFQPQARFFFPLLIPLALLFTWGIRSWLPQARAQGIAFSVLIIWFAFINYLGLMTVANV